MKNLNIFSLTSEYDSAKSEGVLNKPNVSFINEDSSVRYLDIDPYNGYEYVDLGLPSGLKWARCNVGATSPEQAGLYFAWGETKGYTAEQVTAGERVFSLSVYSSGPAASIAKDLSPADGNDAARVNLGGNWRMPTKDEYQELIDNCNVMWTNDYNGTKVSGRLFTSKVNGKWVFFPAAGRCDGSSDNKVGLIGRFWSASWNSSSHAWGFRFYTRDVNVRDEDRSYGFAVRGVCE